MIVQIKLKLRICSLSNAYRKSGLCDKKNEDVPI